MCLCPLILDKHVEVKLPGFTVGVFSTLSETVRCFTERLGHFAFPPECMEEFQLLHILTNTLV